MKYSVVLGCEKTKPIRAKRRPSAGNPKQWVAKYSIENSKSGGFPAGLIRRRWPGARESSNTSRAANHVSGGYFPAFFSALVVVGIGPLNSVISRACCSSSVKMGSLIICGVMNTTSSVIIVDSPSNLKR